MHSVTVRRICLGLGLMVAAPWGGAVLAQDGAATETRLSVSVSDPGCDPASLEAPAGIVVFEISNAGGEVGEFEIILGDRVVDEVENLLPGFQNNVSIRLDGGTYELVCYSLQAPRGVLTITGGCAATPPPSTIVDQAVLDGYQAAYLTWVQAQAADLVSQVDAFVAAIKAGDSQTARSLYPVVRVPWERIEPVAESFADLDVAIDAREEDFAAGVDDPAFTGFHRLERLLWIDGASGDPSALADGLATNVRELQTRLTDLRIDARLMARGAGELIEEVAQSKLTGEEDRYSSTDLWSVGANLDGSRLIVDLFRPTLETLDAAALEGIDAAFAAVDEVMDRYAVGEGYQAFAAVTAEDLTALQARMAGLAEVLAALPGILGLAA